MLEVWRNAGEYEGRSTVATWVFGIARNKSLSQLRRKRDESLSEDDMAELEDPSASPETVAAQGHLATLVDRAMGHLTPEHREVLHLTYRQELSVQEISEITGVPTNTVKTRMFYARQRMKQLLADAGVMEVDP
jgi:RNA polymerase sigma-70 factor (ECF subfamily)